MAQPNPFRYVRGGRSKTEILRAAEELDARRRHQIDNQRASIDRLLIAARTKDVEGASREIKTLHDRIAIAEMILQNTSELILMKDPETWTTPERSLMNALNEQEKTDG